MDTIFLGDTNNIGRVYGGNNTVYTKDYCIANSVIFNDTRYIFTTWGMFHFTEEEIKSTFPALKAVFYAAGSVQHFAREFLNLGIKVFSAASANAVPVAEMAFAHIVLANKGFYTSAKAYKEKGRKAGSAEFSKYKGNYMQKTGILGAGMIGKLLINRLHSINTDILVFDPFLSDEKALELNVRKTTLEDIFSNCSVISNHLANNAQTRGMLTYELFSLMPKNASFINTGRGAQIDESGFIRFLTERPDVLAILDVTDPEPPVDGSPFYSLPNVIISPHIAGSSGYEVRRMGEYMKEELYRYTHDEDLKYEVTLKMLATMA